VLLKETYYIIHLQLIRHIHAANHRP